MGDELHKLFLFEFLVHSVNYSNSTLKLDNDFLKKLGPSCVQFKGKNLPALMVSEVDFCDKGGFNSNYVKFKSGKSCLFSLGNVFIEDCEIKAEVSVKRKLPEGEKAHYCIGRGSLCLNNKFVCVLNSTGEIPTSQCLKTCLEMKNPANETVAHVFLFIRLTCFGTVIITEFQKNNEDNKDFLFKGDKILPLEKEASNLTAIKGDRFSQKDMSRGMPAPQPYGQPHPSMMQPRPFPVNGMPKPMSIPPMPQNFPPQPQFNQGNMNMNMQMQGFNGQGFNGQGFNGQGFNGSPPPPPQFYQQPQQPQNMFQCPPGCMPMPNYY